MVVKNPNSDPDCPFCMDNGRVKLLFSTEEAYVCAVRLPDGTNPPGQYFIIPMKHCVGTENLPVTFQNDRTKIIRWLKREGLIGDDFNASTNQGRLAGARIAHCHEWIIDRNAELGEHPTSAELGLAALITLTGEQAREIEDLKAKLYPTGIQLVQL